MSNTTNFSLQLCNNCGTMTNHVANICQKCRTAEGFSPAQIDRSEPEYIYSFSGDSDKTRPTGEDYSVFTPTPLFKGADKPIENPIKQGSHKAEILELLKRIKGYERGRSLGQYSDMESYIDELIRERVGGGV